MSKKIVHIGIGDAPKGFNMTDAQISELVHRGADEAKRAGYEVDLTFIRSSDLDSKLSQVLEHVREKVSRVTPYGVVFGGGIRLNPAMTPFLEQVVNVCREASPGSKMGFQCKPDDMLEVCQRCFA